MRSAFRMPLTRLAHPAHRTCTRTPQHDDGPTHKIAHADDITPNLETLLHQSDHPVIGFTHHNASLFQTCMLSSMQHTRQKRKVKDLLPTYGIRTLRMAGKFPRVAPPHGPTSKRQVYTTWHRHVYGFFDNGRKQIRQSKTPLLDRARARAFAPSRTRLIRLFASPRTVTISRGGKRYLRLGQFLGDRELPFHRELSQEQVSRERHLRCRSQVRHPSRRRHIHSHRRCGN